MKKNVSTLVDIAKAAGVSPSTASRVLNGGKTVSAELQERVLSIAREYGYAPNLAARALRGSSNTVALLVDDVTTASIAGIVAGMERAARANGSTVTVSASGPVPDSQISSVRVLCALRPRALVLTGRWLDAIQATGRLDNELDPYLAHGGRVVVIGDSNGFYPSVTINNEELGRRMATHVSSLGRSSYLILGGPENHPAMSTRSAAMLKGLLGAGIPKDVVSVQHSELTREAASHAIARSMESSRPDAVLAANDVLAFGAMAELKRRGMRIPEDAVVSGVDDLPLARDVFPALTTMSLPFEDIGRAALRLGLEGPDVAGRRIEFSGELVLRGSTAGEWRAQRKA